MSVVRELVARLGFQVDKSGFKEAEKGIDSIRGALKGADGGLRGVRDRFLGTGSAAKKNADETRKAAKETRELGKAAGGAMDGIAKLAATAGLTAMMHSLVEMASSANETKSALGQVFGAEGGAEVSTWAETMSKQLGRSKYALESFVARLGAVAEPMLGNKDRAREMSEAFSALAVDMGSFYNSSDEDALMALRSAMTGEVESVKRYGVVMNDATLTEYARTQGIKKKILAMTNAEKTELRYGFIMKATKNAQGDAARTSEGYANSVKSLTGLLSEMGTDMGKSVLPRIEKAVRWARDAVTTFRDWAAGTNVLEAAMGVLGATAAVLAYSLAAPFLLPALAIAAMILLVDELYNLFTGGGSVIGDWLDNTFGDGTAEEVVNNLTDAFEEAQAVFNELRETLPDLTGMFEILGGVGDDVGFTIEYLIGQVADFLDLLANLPQRLAKALGNTKAGNAFLNGLGIKLDQDDAAGRAAGRGLDAGLQDGSLSGQLAQRQKEREERTRTGSESRTAARTKRHRLQSIDAELAGKGPVDWGKMSPEDQAAYTAKQLGLQQERAALLGDETTLQSVNDQVDEEGGRTVDPDAEAAAEARGWHHGRARRRPRPGGPAVAAAGPLEAGDPMAGGMSADPSLFPPASVSAPAMSEQTMSSMQPQTVNVAGSTIVINNPVNPREVERVAKGVLDAQNRKAAAALGRPAGA